MPAPSSGRIICGPVPFATATEISPGATIHTDICVVGSGPAGLSLALELSRAGKDVLLVESGGQPREDDAVGVDEIETAGASPGGEGPLHHRRFGGTEWYGRCIAFAPIDFERRPWAAGSGWPIAVDEITSRYDRAAAFLGVARPAAIARDFWAREAAIDAMSGGGLEPDIHVVTSASVLGRRYLTDARRAPRLRVLLHATVVAVEVDRQTRAVAQLRVAGPGGAEFSIRAGRHVLACGGFENARLLLILARDHPEALGESAGMVGRGYVNHVRSEGVGRLRLRADHPQSRAIFRRLTLQYSRRSRSWLQIGAALSPDTQRREGLLGAGAFFHGASTPELAALKSEIGSVARQGRPRLPTSSAAVRLAAGLPLLAQAGLARLGQRPFGIDHLVLVDQIEQSVDAGSRVTLSDRSDRFGRPEIRLDWRIGSDTRRAQRRLHQLLAARVAELGVGTLESPLVDDPKFEAPVGDARHPTGATRMSLDARGGVVDGNLRVHGVENLYVAGSSVFPSGGYAGPTLTIVALSLRLADYLRRPRT
jgi:choline dehydrogenase-like flavoprotein